MDDGPIRILLVEDNPGDARLLHELLKEAPDLSFDLIRVERLAEAREHLAAYPTDVILLDLSLPDARGVDTVDQMLEPAGSAPIIVLTGVDDEQIATRAVQAGAQDYLAKGRVDGNILGRAIRYAVERKRLEVERQLLLGREQAARVRAELAVLTAEGAVRRRDEMVSVVSHDLRNPLGTVIMAADFLRELLQVDKADSVERRQLDIISRASGSMNRIIQDLLDIAQIESGRLSVELLTLSIESLAEDVSSQLHRLATNNDQVLTFTFPPDLPAIRADRERMLQILSNLVGNASKFTPAGGRITLSAEADGPTVWIRVSDSGSGIPPENLPHLFDRFWQANRSDRRGIGLGLPIVKGLVEAQGGTIEVDSVVGEGTTFSFSVPIADERIAAG